MPTVAAATAAFRARFGSECRVARAPGRVNLIGEHTDYNDGFVLPVAIDRFVSVAFQPRQDSTLRGYSLAFDEERSAAIDTLRPCKGSPTWFDYAAGVAWALDGDDSGVAPRGMDFVLAGDIPIGAGLSSSAAVELAVARALWDMSGRTWDGGAAALVGQRVENDFIGVRSGIMDQMACALCEDDSAMLLDCRHLTSEPVPIPPQLAIVVMDTGTRRGLAGSAYNQRRASCERVVAAARAHAPGVTALRDVDEALLDACADEIDATDRRRALHVVQENKRTLDMAAALRAADCGAIGALMEASHASLRDLYEVSSPELDRIVSVASAHAACVGARMTGAGFGGCAVALVDARQAQTFADDVGNDYPGGELHVCRAVSGAQIV